MIRPSACGCGALIAAGLVLGAGCDIVRGPSPLNDAPVIRRLGEYVFVSGNDEIMTTRAFVDLTAEQRREWDLEVVEPEGERLTVTVGPLPRGWSYDEGRKLLVAEPDHRQRDLLFVVYIVAEDAHHPPAYDVRVLEFNVQ
ncbi:MAG: hypothetical protein JXR83_07115 [Deltaproteobacteria bacterium]|nr:hypothetical protein [Deltaproteobacteria bacterium]